MITVNKTRITFDFNNDRTNSYNKLEQIICSSHWSSGIDIFGIINENHSLLFDFVKRGVIVIDECEYELREQCPDSESARYIKSMLGKRSDHPVLSDIAALIANEPFGRADYYSNTLYLPNLKAYIRADGMKPEDIADMLASDSCDKIILFPYFPLGEKSAYYEVTLGSDKQLFADYMHRYEERRSDEMNEAVRQISERTMERIIPPVSKPKNENGRK